MTTPQWKKIAESSRKFKEKNDCGVCALALVTGIGYQKAHQMLQERGRKKGKRTTMPMLMESIQACGFRSVEWDIELILSLEALTLRSAERNLPRKGVYLIGSSRHVTCMRDGVIHDHARGRLKYVKEVYTILRETD